MRPTAQRCHSHVGDPLADLLRTDCTARSSSAVATSEEGLAWAEFGRFQAPVASFETVGRLCRAAYNRARRPQPFVGKALGSVESERYDRGMARALIRI
jgi:hypothetical protein